MSMFASTSPRETLRFQGNKIHCCCHIRVTLQLRFVESTFELSVGHVLLTALKVVSGWQKRRGVGMQLHLKTNPYEEDDTKVSLQQ